MSEASEAIERELYDLIGGIDKSLDYPGMPYEDRKLLKEYLAQALKVAFERGRMQVIREAKVTVDNVCGELRIETEKKEASKPKKNGGYDGFHGDHFI